MGVHVRIWVCLFAVLSFTRAHAGDPSGDGKLKLAEPHLFSRSEARARVQQLLDYWSSEFGVQRSWQGDTARIRGTVMGVPFDGNVVVGDHDVLASTSDPGLLLRGKAVDYVQRKLKKYLHPTYESE